MVSYKVIDKDTKPYVEVIVGGDKKVRRSPSHISLAACGAQRREGAHL
jgi:hypothetical protein